MDFYNNTPYSAHLFRGVIRENRMFASLACRITYDIIAGELVFAEQQPWPVSPGPWDSPQGPFAPDEVFYRGGADFFVFGNATAPTNRPQQRIDVSLEVGMQFKRTLAVFGDRVWEKRGKEIVASAPKPFSTMPMTMANAYGGKDVWDELDMPFAANPDGKGYCFNDENVIGTRLPNIEDPAKLIATWRDQPEPVGCAAPSPVWAVKVQHFCEFNMQTGELKKIDPRLFNTCFPDMIITKRLVLPGDEVRITGMRANGPLKFLIPPNPLAVQVWIDDFCHAGVPVVDQIGVEVELNRAFVTYRYPFRYEIVPLEKRSCLLVPAGTGTNELPLGHTPRARNQV